MGRFGTSGRRCARLCWGSIFVRRRYGRRFGGSVTAVDSSVRHLWWRRRRVGRFGTSGQRRCVRLFGGTSFVRRRCGRRFGGSVTALDSSVRHFWRSTGSRRRHVGRQGVSTIVRRRWARNFGWSASGCGRRAGVAWVGIIWHGSCAVRQVVWGSRRNTDERKRNDTTERSELFKCVS